MLILMSVRKHVKEDLQPYVCIYEDCPLPDRLFSSTEEWRKHIYVYHSTITWECSFCVQSPTHIQQFESADKMEAHLRSAHLKTHVLTESQLNVAVDKGTQFAPCAVDICPICTKTELQLEEEGTGDILDHIATEFLDLAFEAVVRNDDLCDSSGGSERANPQDDFSQGPRADSVYGSEMNERSSLSPSIKDDQTYAGSDHSTHSLTIRRLRKVSMLKYFWQKDAYNALNSISTTSYCDMTASRTLLQSSQWTQKILYTMRTLRA